MLYLYLSGSKFPAALSVPIVLTVVHVQAVTILDGLQRNSFRVLHLESAPAITQTLVHLLFITNSLFI